MKRYNAYLIDLDGTMYRGNEPIESAAAFVGSLASKEIPYLFLTNNSSKTQLQVSEKLEQMAIPSTPEHVFTSSMATAKYIKRLKASARCFVIGEEGLHDALEREGLTITDTGCDFVVFGIDRDINYEKLSKACREVRNGATFISTNGDVALPTDRGLEPGNGALTSVVSVSTGKQPIFIGKPETIIMDQALDQIGADREKTLMVGDNYHTDILAGINAGIDTLMVFTGVTPYTAYPTLETKPSYHVHNLNEWLQYI
ncbi:TIGR01457 family HAD-type hydrolase [Lentibacillus sp. CBA3610]|uniref:TIGR01457 family HAD-type hydrolase n=1 Tax=Lentibacillus sp. CBA3610 TaxID=2518176 RepID=UPI001595A6E5|nr:TIGR01457 family HAD-type hydrolase [Lentibacillus sp. CBA3610]QKY69788.1 TIGR01457 family HAD-type hydrolase [Lentibacillus sp. CBA3610]